MKSLLLSSLLVVVAGPRFRLAAPEWRLENCSRADATRWSQSLRSALLREGVELVPPGSEALAVEEGPDARCADGALCLGRRGNLTGDDGQLQGTLTRRVGGGWRLELDVLAPGDATLLTRTVAEAADDAEMGRSIDSAAAALRVGLETVKPLPPPGPPIATAWTRAARTQTGPALVAAGAFAVGAASSARPAQAFAGIGLGAATLVALGIQGAVPDPGFTVQVGGNPGAIGISALW